MDFLQKKYRCNNIIITFDCVNKSWRKLYTHTSNTEKVTHKIYKAGRREGLTFSESEKLAEFDKSIQRFVNFFKTQTTVLCLQENYLEGDDLIAGYVQMFKKDDHVIYSSDKDFMQLINSIDGNVILVESSKDTERTLDDWSGDPKLFLFEKCFRGEQRGGDNVQSAYPRLLRTKIIKAYTDNFLQTNIMNNKFTVGDIDHNGEPVVYEYRTGDLFEENKMLMGLSNQPQNIRELIYNSILKSINEQKYSRFDYMGFLKFCKLHGMDRAIKEKDRFMNVLSSPYLASTPSPSFLG